MTSFPKQPSKKLRTRTSPPSDLVIGTTKNEAHYLGFVMSDNAWWLQIKFRQINGSKFSQEDTTDYFRSGEEFLTTDTFWTNEKVEIWTWEDDRGFRTHIEKAK